MLERGQKITQSHKRRIDKWFSKRRVEWGLTSQIRRSSRSIGNKIAQGFGRYHYQENIQFYRIARGSLNETLDHGIVVFDEGYISEEKLMDLRKLHDKTLKILNGYIAYLKRSKFEG